MELKGERTLPASRQVAWDALNDVEVLRLCVPGCESITATAENKYAVVVNTAIGPVKARFTGKLELADIDAPNGYTIKFDGTGGQAGFARGDARVTLESLAPQQTKLTYVATSQVGGRLAQVGSRLIDAAAGAMADRFFAAFSDQLSARAAPAGAAAPAAGAAAKPATIGFWSLFVAFLRRLFSRAPLD